MNRCTGHCCRAFPLPIIVPFATSHDALACEPDRFQDGRQIRDMIIPLGKRDLGGEGGWRDHYTCRHHDAASGNCTNYVDRPRMCTDYPYGKACEIEGCTYVAPSPLVPGVYPIVVEYRVILNGVIVFGGERWRCMAYRDLIVKAQPNARIEWILVDPPVHTTIGRMWPERDRRVPWPPRLEPHHP